MSKTKIYRFYVDIEASSYDEAVDQLDSDTVDCMYNYMVLKK